MSYKKIIIFIVLVIGLAVLSGALAFTKGPTTLDQTETDMELSANHLLADYTEDEKASNHKYLDKVLLVKGEVKKIVNKNDAFQIFLKTEDKMASIICQFDQPPSLQPNIGDLIEVKGICTGYLLDVVLIKSKLKDE